MAGVTANPDAAWVTQQARTVGMDLQDLKARIGFLLRDHDAKFTGSFDAVFTSEGARVLRTPIQAPRANAYAERWVATVRAECLDWTPVQGQRQLLWILCGYGRHYNQQRPHRGLALAVPDPSDHGSLWQGVRSVRAHDVRARGVLGGLIREYHAVAA